MDGNPPIHAKALVDGSSEKLRSGLRVTLRVTHDVEKDRWDGDDPGRQNATGGQRIGPTQV